ncbi:MAG TPA: sulfotransferase, partial [Rubrobacter sp.]|nr:sulfotransferase [Rubrobacter sp.]
VLPRLYEKLFGRRVVDRRWRRQIKNRLPRHLKTFAKEDLLWDLRYYAGRPGDEWYLSLFEPGRGKVVGEITPSYSKLEPEIIARIHEMMPRAKIVFLMRNPVERAWSQVVMRFGKIEGDIDAATERQLRRNFESEGSRSRTDYLQTLENWGAFYDEDQIFVGFLEDIHFFPKELLHRVFDFLGVDASFTPPELEQKVHSRSAGRMPASVAVYLARMYRGEISRLSERYGGYASFWLYCAERLSENPPEQEYLPYPLWESGYWKEWAGSAEESPRPRLQSAPLPSARVA